MSKLSSDSFAGIDTTSSTWSFGPFVSVDGEHFKFDTQWRTMPIWLGHFAAPMSGVLLYRESLTGKWSDEMLRFRESYLRLLQRTRTTLCGRLRLIPHETNLSSPRNGREFTPAVMIYQHAAISVLDQFSDIHGQLADSIESNLKEILSTYGDLIRSSFVDSANFEFGFEFNEKMTNRNLELALQKAGIYNESAAVTEEASRLFPTPTDAENRCIFQLNFAFHKFISLFWSRLRLAFQSLRNETLDFPSSTLERVIDNRSLIEFNRGLQIAQATQKVPAEYSAVEFLTREFAERNQHLKPVILDSANYQKYRELILEMQVDVYEPTRRSPPAEFDMLFRSEQPLSIIVLAGNRIAGMVFAGRLGLFRQERGVNSDPFVDDPTVYYSMDLTVAPEYRGGLGTLLKRALVMLAIEIGVTAIHGRNRDRLAAGMWKINLSLGSYELQHLPNDYPDNQPYRDCLYYRCPLSWNPIDLSVVDQFDNWKMINGTL